MAQFDVDKTDEHQSTENGKRMNCFCTVTTVISVIVLIAVPIIYFAVGGSAIRGFAGHIATSPDDNIYFLKGFSGYKAVSRSVFLFMKVTEISFFAAIPAVILSLSYISSYRGKKNSALNNEK